MYSNFSKFEYVNETNKKIAYMCDGIKQEEEDSRAKKKITKFISLVINICDKLREIIIVCEC